MVPCPPLSVLSSRVAPPGNMVGLAPEAGRRRNPLLGRLSDPPMPVSDEARSASCPGPSLDPAVEVRAAWRPAKPPSLLLAAPCGSGHAEERNAAAKPPLAGADAGSVAASGAAWPEAVQAVANPAPRVFAVSTPHRMGADANGDWAGVNAPPFRPVACAGNASEAGCADAAGVGLGAAAAAKPHVASVA